MKPIDLRSDTVTRPTPAMQAVMAEAPLGDDVYGEDPSVNALEAYAAQLLGKEQALFVASGTQSNLCALLSHCQRGDEYIAGQTAHTYRYEAGGAAVLGGIQPQPLPLQQDGTLDLDQVRAAVKPDDPHFARSRLLCLENTHNGRPQPLPYYQSAREVCDESGLLLHLDGARLFNAAVALDVAARDFARHCDSVSVCLSKGLGAPVGSLLLGNAAMIQRARRWRKMLGGGMRQAGLLAAAGLHALKQHTHRLAEDHRRAACLAQELNAFRGLRDRVHAFTNMLFLDLPVAQLERLTDYFLEREIRVRGARWVTHLDIDDNDIDRILSVAGKFPGFS